MPWHPSYCRCMKFGLFFLMACLEVKKRRESKVEEGRENQILCLEVFYEIRGRDLEGFGGVSITSNPSFLIPSNWRDLEGV